MKKNLLLVNIRNQELLITNNDKHKVKYPISTSKNGMGNEYGREKTPLGKHRICEKIGEGAAKGTVFQERKNTGIISCIYKKRAEYPYEQEQPCITTRILWLEGLEEGINKGESIGSYERKIYIHGTPYEYDIGRPASLGCVRMKNEDVIDLFDLVDVGDEVLINQD